MKVSVDDGTAVPPLPASLAKYADEEVSPLLSGGTHAGSAARGGKKKKNPLRSSPVDVSTEEIATAPTAPPHLLPLALAVFGLAGAWRSARIARIITLGDSNGQVFDLLNG